MQGLFGGIWARNFTSPLCAEAAAKGPLSAERPADPQFGYARRKWLLIASGNG